MRGKIIAVVVTVVVLICGVAGGLHYLEDYEHIYYSQIDNTKITELSANNEMKYEYKLDCYDEKGKKRELKFKTSRELREDAYILLEVRSLGVHKWEEVQYNDLPEKVQEKMN